MSENYSNEMFDLVNRTRKILNNARSLYNEEDFKSLKAKAHDNVSRCESMINDDLSLALCITTGGLSYYENGVIYNSALTDALLSKQVETAYGVKSDFMHRDEDKQPTLYEIFANEYFDKMFGDNGYRQLFSGDSTGFMSDFRKFGATNEEIIKFDNVIKKSIETGAFDMEDAGFLLEMCTKVSENRKQLEKGEQVITSNDNKEEVPTIKKDALEKIKEQLLESIESQETKPTKKFS